MKTYKVKIPGLDKTAYSKLSEIQFWESDKEGCTFNLAVLVPDEEE